MLSQYRHASRLNSAGVGAVRLTRAISARIVTCDTPQHRAIALSCMPFLCCNSMAAEYAGQLFSTLWARRRPTVALDQSPLLCDRSSPSLPLLRSLRQIEVRACA